MIHTARVPAMLFKVAERLGLSYPLHDLIRCLLMLYLIVNQCRDHGYGA